MSRDSKAIEWLSIPAADVFRVSKSPSCIQCECCSTPPPCPFFIYVFPVILLEWILRALLCVSVDEWLGTFCGLPRPPFVRLLASTMWIHPRGRHEVALLPQLQLVDFNNLNSNETVVEDAVEDLVENLSQTTWGASTSLIRKPWRTVESSDGSCRFQLQLIP